MKQHRVASGAPPGGVMDGPCLTDAARSTAPGRAVREGPLCRNPNAIPAILTALLIRWSHASPLRTLTLPNRPQPSPTHANRVTATRGCQLPIFAIRNDARPLVLSPRPSSLAGSCGGAHAFACPHAPSRHHAHWAPVLQRRPNTPLKPESVDRRGGINGPDAVKADAHPLEAAFFQHAPRRRV